jgi:hypothetical protein
MNKPDYTAEELWVMERMAHGVTREGIASVLRSPKTGRRGSSMAHVARIARSAADKTECQSIVHAIAVMVANAWISVEHNGQKATAHDTALHWLHTRIMSALDWREVVELRTAYKRMIAEEQT